MFDVYFHTAASQPCARQCFRLESSSSCSWNSVSGFVTIPSLALRKRGCKIAATATHSRARSISSGLRFLGRDLGDVLVFTTKNSFEQKHMLVARPMMSLLSSLLTGTPPAETPPNPGSGPRRKTIRPPPPRCATCAASWEAGSHQRALGSSAGHWDVLLLSHASAVEPVGSCEQTQDFPDDRHTVLSLCDWWLT